MVVVRFKVKCQPGKTEHALALFQDVVEPSRKVEGVVHFDIGRDISDPDSILAFEVFEDMAAVERQESLPEVGKILSVLPQMIAAAPEATRYHVASAESAM